MNEGASAAELRNLLQVRDQEIQALKYELDKYKLALQQSQLNYHLVQQQLERHRRNTGSANAARPVASSRATVGTDDDSGVMQEEQHATDDILIVSTSSRRSSAGSKPLESTPKRAPSSRCSKVLFKTGDDSDDGQSDLEHEISAIAGNNDTPYNGNVLCTMSKSEENLDDIIHDVGEIDLELELSKIAGGSSRKASSAGPRVMDVNEPLDQIDDDNKNDDDEDNDVDEDVDVDDDDEDGDGDDEDIISDELLTSLTDAAINNLSQLAALQEQCESQQQHSQQTKYQAPSANGAGGSTGASNNNKQPSSSSNHPHHAQMSRQQSSQSSCFSVGAGEQSTSAAATPLSPQNVANPLRLMEHRQSKTIDFTQDPFSSVSISNQAAIAISAAAAAAAASGGAASATSSPITGSSINCQPHAMAATKTTLLQPNSSSTSVASPTNSTTIQSDLTSTSHSLASVVAAAAVAAAAANDQHRQQQHSSLLNHPNTGVNHPQARLVSSALSHTQDYYHQHQQQHHHHQQYHHGSPIPSALSTLHFSPSTSITPSPCSLLGGTGGGGGGSTSQSTRRSTPSNASSSIVSPTTLPTYLRRQFLPSADRLPSMSPSPSSGLATGTSSAASGSLAHILQSHHQHQQQQRSVSALAGGHISSPTGTPLSGTGSSAVSPLMYSKSPSQARLNNMQIRHKFGYLGSGKAQFNSPHGFCLGLNQEIVVADTNNHRVCIFDKSGTYITQFGSPGKEEGQLWNPRKVAILHRPVRGAASGGSSSSGAIAAGTTGDQRIKSSYSGAASADSSHSEPLYVVCDRGAERSRMQLFTKDGAFIKKIGIHYIDIVAGLAITQNGLIIVVDSVSPTVYIINGETGILNGWFDCSGYMKEPSDIAVKSDVPGNEYFICDFKGHCVVVFSEQGEYLRKIGHDGLTSYPNGIDISDDGDILVGDSHGNRFHVVVFDRYGNFVSQFECPHVKVSRCCGLKITREGYIVTLAKNNHHVLVLDTIHI